MIDARAVTVLPTATGMIDAQAVTALPTATGMIDARAVTVLPTATGMIDAHVVTVLPTATGMIDAQAATVLPTATGMIDAQAVTVLPTVTGKTEVHVVTVHRPPVTEEEEMVEVMSVDSGNLDQSRMVLILSVRPRPEANTKTIRSCLNDSINSYHIGIEPPFWGFYDDLP
jgi:hypothetical protein